MRTRMQIFVSHAVEDRDEVVALVDRLSATLPDCSFFVSSSGGIKPGEEWWKSIEHHLRDAVAVIIVLSPRSLDRPWLYFEGGAAWAMQKPIIPVLIDGLSARAIPYPLAAFQGIVEEGRTNALSSRISELMGIEMKSMPTPAPGSEHVSGATESLLPGVHVAHRRLSLDVGWVRYSGDGELRVSPNYIDTGRDFDDGYRFPPKDTLGAASGALGIRIMRLQEVHFYAICTLMEGRQIKIYASTLHNEWGFSGTPSDEFRVPLPMVTPSRWHIVVFRLRSFDRVFGGEVRSLDGFRLRGGMRLSHIWCASATETLPSVTTGDRVSEIVWPS